MADRAEEMIHDDTVSKLTIATEAQGCSRMSGQNECTPNAESKVNIEFSKNFERCVLCVLPRSPVHLAVPGAIKHHSTSIRSATEATDVKTRRVRGARVGHLSCATDAM